MMSGRWLVGRSDEGSVTEQVDQSTYQHGLPRLRRRMKDRHQVQLHRQIVRSRQVVQGAQFRHQIVLVFLEGVECVHVVLHGQLSLQTSSSDGGRLLHMYMLPFL